MGSIAGGQGDVAMTPSSELLETLAELQQRYPHWRFGQLLANVAGWADRDV
jgi:hypothetical protein